MPKTEQPVPKTEQPANGGLLGAMEAMVETAKRFQEYEEHYRANEAAFGQIQQQFRQVQDGAAQLQSMAEERLASLNAMNVELKVRHSQGEQTLTEVRGLLDQIKAQQTQWAAQWQEKEAQWQEKMAGGHAPSQLDAGQLAKLGQTVEALTAQLEGRQVAVEHAMLAVEALLAEHGKRNVEQQDILSEVRNLAHHTADRQAQTEKAFSIFQATHEAERGLLAHFEKSIDVVRTMAVELQKRQAQLELNLGSLKTSSGDSTVNERVLAPLRALIDQAQQAAARAAEEADAKCKQAVETAQAAQQLATQAMEKAAEAPMAVPIAEPTPEDKQKAVATFQQFLARCQADHKSAMEMEARLQTQVRMALEGLPSRTEGIVQKFLDQSRARVEQMVSGWLQQREQRMLDLESRHDQLVVKALEAHQMLEQEMAKRNQGDGDEQPSAATKALLEAIEAASSAQGSEVRFVKTLLWVALGAVGLGYVLVMIAYSSLRQ